MRHQSAKIALRPGGHKECGLFACDGRNPLLQSIDRRIVTKYIITQWGFHHGLQHGRCWLCHCVAAEVNDHDRSKKFLSMACPCSVSMDSG